jgi:hypothetical protein
MLRRVSKFSLMSASSAQPVIEQRLTSSARSAKWLIALTTISTLIEPPTNIVVKQFRWFTRLVISQI